MKYFIFLCFFVNQSIIFANKRPISHTVQSAKSYNNKFVITHDLKSNSLIIMDSKNLIQLKSITVLSTKGEYSDVSGLHDASSRNSFIITLKDSPEIWEINYQNPSPVGFGTWTHDYRKDSGESIIRLFPIRKIRLKIPLDDFFFGNNFVNIISVSCAGNIQIVDLDLGKKVAMFHLSETDADKKNPFKIKNLNHSLYSKILAKATQFKLKSCN